MYCSPLRPTFPVSFHDSGVLSWRSAIKANAETLTSLSYSSLKLEVYKAPTLLWSQKMNVSAKRKHKKKFPGTIWNCLTLRWNEAVRWSWTRTRLQGANSYTWNGTLNQHKAGFPSAWKSLNPDLYSSWWKDVLTPKLMRENIPRNVLDKIKILVNITRSLDCLWQ